MTSPINIKRHIVLDMTDTKKQQKKSRQELWNGYNVAIIKDSDTALDRLQEALLKKRTHRNMTSG